MTQESRPSWIFSLLMVLAMVAWGGSWITARWAHAGQPELTAFWRFMANALTLIPFVLLWERPNRRSEDLRPNWGTVAWVVAAAFSLAVYNVLFLTAMKTGLAGYGGVMVPSLNPQFAFLLGLLFFGTKAGWIQGLGLALGLAGGVLQILGPDFLWSRFGQPENLLLVSAAAVYALLTHLGSRSQARLGVFSYSFWTALLAGLMLLPLALQNPGQAFVPVNIEFWVNALYLGIAAGTFGTTLYFEASRRLGGARGASYAFLVPASALVLAWIFLGEIPLWTSLAGGALSIGAVLLIQKK